MKARALGAVFLVALGACDRGPDPEATARPLNVVFVVLDTLRPDHLGGYGYARATSPGLDALARESCLFERAVTVSPWTAPSLLSLMTSLHPEVHGVIESPNPGRMSESLTTLAEILKTRGYATAAFTEGGYAKGQFGLDQGFDLYPENPGDSPDHHDILAHESRIRGNVDRTLAWLRERGNAPFFLFFHTYAVHSPYRAPEDLVRRIDPSFDEGAEHERARAVIETWNREKTIAREDCLLLFRHKLRNALAGMPWIEDAQALYRTARELGVDPKEPWRHAGVVDRARDLYDACILHADQELARLWAVLDERPLREATLLVVVSDHGEGLGQHGEMEHGSVLNEEALRIALLFRGPTVAARRVESVVSLVDVAPSVLELLGTGRADAPFQGRSLVPLMKGEARDLPAYSHGRTVDRAADAQHSLRMGRWHLIADLASGERRLYDLASDPGEIVDLAPTAPDTVARLEALLERQRAGNQALRKALAAGIQRLDLDRATLDDLRRLGYAGGEDEERK